MNLIPQNIQTDVNVNIRFEQDSLLLLAAVIVAIIIIAFLSQKIIKGL